MKALTEERLFEPFMDAVDGILCVPATSTAGRVNDEAVSHGLRFPLFVDRQAPLSQQVAASPYAPASSRFGPYCDNITGMNWEMADGRRVRIGERVVTSTTGYDLFRFLLGSGERYGRPLDYVLRLRPACEIEGVFFIRGDLPVIRQALARILQSSWMHWFESIDVIAETTSTPVLRMAVHCPRDEWPIYGDYLSVVTRPLGLSLHAEITNEPIYDGCPDLVIKSAPDLVVEQAVRLSAQTGNRCVALCYCGVIHVFVRADECDSAYLGELMRPLEPGLHAIGGDWQSRHVPQPIPGPPESAWIKTLLTEWQIPE